MALDRKAQIIKKATILFSKSGYDKISIKNIAAACKVSEAALYRHFKSKDAIYDAVLENARSKISNPDLFEDLANEEEFETVLTKTADFLITLLQKKNDLYRLLLYSALRGDLRAKEMYSVIRGNYINFIKSQIEKFRKKGDLYKTDPYITARCFIGSVLDCALGLNLWRGIDGKAVKPEKAIENNIPIYVRGLIKENKRKKH